MPIDEATLKKFAKWGATPPTSEAHGTTDDVRANLKPVTMTNWRQEGNKLICDTEHGTLVNFIPTTKLLIGTDENGLPVFKDIVG